MVWTAVAAAFVVEPRFTSRTISLFCSGLTQKASTNLQSHAKASNCNRQVREGNGERKEGGGSHAVTSYHGFSLLVAEYLEQALAIDDQSQIAELIQPSTMDCSEKRRNLRELLRWNGGVGSLSLLAEKSLRPCTIRLRFLLLFS